MVAYVGKVFLTGAVADFERVYFEVTLQPPSTRRKSLRRLLECVVMYFSAVGNVDSEFCFSVAAVNIIALVHRLTPLLIYAGAMGFLRTKHTTWY